MEHPPTPPPITTARALDLTPPRLEIGRFELEPVSGRPETVARELDRRAVGRVADPLDEEERRGAPDAEGAQSEGRASVTSRRSTDLTGRTPNPSAIRSRASRSDPCPRCRGRAARAGTTARLRAACPERGEARDHDDAVPTARARGRRRRASRPARPRPRSARPTGAALTAELGGEADRAGPRRARVRLRTNVPPPARRRGAEAVPLELAERLPHGHPADPERLGQPALGREAQSPGASAAVGDRGRRAASAIDTCSGLEPRSSTIEGRIHRAAYCVGDLSSRPLCPQARGQRRYIATCGTYLAGSRHRTDQPRGRGNGGRRRVLAQPLRAASRRLERVR